MYTLIFMSSRGKTVYQRAISRRDMLLFWVVIFGVVFAAIGGVGYGFFQKQRKAVAETELLTSTEEIEGLTRAKLDAEVSLAAVGEEMKDIRDMTEQVQQTLAIFGQGGGNSDITETEASTDVQQERTSVIPETPDRQKVLTPTLLRQEIQPVYDYVSEHRKGIDEYPSILPVELQKADGEAYGFWYSSHFGRRTHPLTKRREFHQGLDIKTRAGVPVVAAADGTVVTVERNGYLGNTVEIRHEATQFKTLYAHLKGYADGLKVDQKVTRGETIGYVGSTGRTTGAHLHYGIYNIETERWVNPIAYIFDQQPIFSP